MTAIRITAETIRNETLSDSRNYRGNRRNRDGSMIEGKAEIETT